MIIPIKCFTCGQVLADKYRFWVAEVRRRKLGKLENGEVLENIKYLSHENVEKTVEAEVLEELRLVDMCCKRHMLTHVDIN